MSEKLTFLQFVNLISGGRYIVVNDLNEIDKDVSIALLEDAYNISVESDSNEDCDVDMYAYVITNNEDAQSVREYAAMCNYSIPIQFSEKLEKIVIGVPFNDDWSNYLVN